MKRNLFLTLGILAVLLITAWSVYGREKQTTTVQQWEYKTVITYRATGSANFTNWMDNGVEIPGPVSITKKLNELGPLGWELVAAVPISNTANSVGYGNVNPYDQSGFTNQITYILKRPKQ